MFKQTVPLNSEKHRNLRLEANRPYFFARELMTCPIVSGEFAQIARDFVIVFAAEAGAPPQALLGTEKGINAYVADSGHWLCRYVPAHIRRYPFIAAPRTGEGAADGAMVVLVDESAPQLSETEGQPLFTADGKPAPMLERVQQALVSLQRDFLASGAMVNQLAAQGVLVESPVQVKLKSGKVRRLGGFRIVDAKKLMVLEPDALSALHRSGALMLAYAHLVSMANLRDGVLINDELRTAAAAKAAPDNFAAGLGDTLELSRLN